MTWSSQQYLKFEDERTRAARDLLQAVPTARVSSAADLGCRGGNSTELLVEHYPDARIVGVDNSAEMVEAAQKRLPYVKFRLGCDRGVGEGKGPRDILLANAVFQWIGDHERLLGRLMERLTPAGSLAIQMPGQSQRAIPCGHAGGGAQPLRSPRSSAKPRGPAPSCTARAGITLC